MKSTLTNMVLSLGIITIIAAALLAGVYTITEAPIKAAQLNKQIEAIKAVTPAFDNDPVNESMEITPQGESVPVKVFPAKMGGKLVGAAVESYSSQGFSGDIKLIYGFDTEHHRLCRDAACRDSRARRKDGRMVPFARRSPQRDRAQPFHLQSHCQQGRRRRGCHHRRHNNITRIPRRPLTCRQRVRSTFSTEIIRLNYEFKTQNPL